ncbi:MAG TPA: hypothetical protein VHX11_00605 [Acidobacteriaceae bacterium]|nr:hypothetical protein [Acidobacteriaceae bacterium]
MTDPNDEAEKIAGETLFVAWGAIALAMISLAYCFRHGLLLLFGDAVAHMYIARRIFDSRNPGYRQLGSVWLPLPHLLLAPFVARMSWWQNGVAGAWVSIPSYALGCAGLYRLARVWLPAGMAIVALAFFAFNPGLLYMATTAMTEPLFLAEMIWAVLLIVLFELALRGGSYGVLVRRSPQRLLLWAGVVLVGAVFTRYDGWILGAVLWVFATVRVFTIEGAWRKVRGAWVAFTVILASAPLLWLAYNAKNFGDPLDFMRGPYSARAIEARTKPAGGYYHPGWHNMRVATLYFLKVAELGATPQHCADVLFCISLAGAAAAVVHFRGRAIWTAMVLWLPLPFYAYSVAYGSVPIFFPLWFPHSWYNIRYGMEMLPIFALSGAFFFALLAEFARRRQWLKLPAPVVERTMAAVLLALIAANTAVLLRTGPLVYEEAVVNSRSRVAFDHAVANALMLLPPEPVILMDASVDAGAIEEAGLPLRRTLNEGDDLEWRRALADPAMAAPIAIALDGDPVARAIQDHPENMDLVKVICSSGEPCARIYWSKVYTPRL